MQKIALIVKRKGVGVAEVYLFALWPAWQHRDSSLEFQGRVMQA